MPNTISIESMAFCQNSVTKTSEQLFICRIAIGFLLFGKCFGIQNTALYWLDLHLVQTD